MDLGTLITGIMIILLCIIPFVLMRVNSKKREKELLQRLNSLAEQSNGNITCHDLWDNFLIGIDNTTNKLVFIKKVTSNETFKQADLAEVQKCRILDNSRTINNKDGNYKITDQVGLVLTYHDKSKNETALEFYNTDYGSLMLKGELILAEKWSKIINAAIPAKTN